MIHVVASIHIKGGKMGQFMEIFKSNVPNVLKEAGCLEYVPTVDLPTNLPLQEVNMNVATIVEKWRGLEDLQTHLTAPHMLAYKENVKDLVEKVSINILKET